MVIAIIVLGIISLALIGLLSAQISASDKEMKKLESLIEELTQTLQVITGLLQDLDVIIDNLIDCMQTESKINEESDDIFNLN